MTVKQKLRKIVMVAVDDIQGAGFNPRDRTETKNLEMLRDYILRAGEIINPVILSRDMKVIDGNRRVAVARMLGWSHVPAIVVEYGLQDGWVLLNAATRPVTPREWADAAHRGLSTKFMPAKHARPLEALRAIAGDEGIALLAERRKSTWILHLVRKIARAMDDDSNEYMADVLRWLIQHDAQYSARRALEDGHIEELAYAIANDVPLRAPGNR